MRLTYFVSPYDLLDEKSHCSVPLTVEAVTGRTLGQSVEVCIEGSSTNHKLPTMPLISITPAPPGGKRYITIFAWLVWLLFNVKQCLWIYFKMSTALLATPAWVLRTPQRCPPVSLCASAHPCPCVWRWHVSSSRWQRWSAVTYLLLSLCSRSSRSTPRQGRSTAPTTRASLWWVYFLLLVIHIIIVPLTATCNNIC